MPPHIEIDSHHDELCPAPRSPTLYDDEQPSPLFRDSEVVIPISPLDRRQSDPNFSDPAEVKNRSLVLKDAPTKKAVTTARPVVVSRITAIIGPESAYIRNTTVSNNNNRVSTTTAKGTTTTTTTSSSVATKTATKAAAATTTTTTSAQKKKQPQTNKKDTKPIFLRASRYVSKKGLKVVKFLPNKVASTVGSINVKVPGHHRNVV
mmetsp:Transcript_14122/g.21286  ORF Transcript_14122/g.21286 Transcript_14122/m.21286 type:complete len:206 (+) Transcript_14122:48-665(+)